MSKIKRITPEAQLEIIKGIEFLANKGIDITWKMLEDEFEFTRAAMSRKKEIKEAYDDAKSDVKKGKSSVEKLEELKDKNEKLQRQLDTAKKTISRLESKYLNWVYNAQNNGLSAENLNMPIPESAKTTMRRKGIS